MRSTPYPNGANIAVDVADQFILHCACGDSCRFTLRQLQTYSVVECAYLRGYGSSVEIVPTTRVGKMRTVLSKATLFTASE